MSYRLAVDVGGTFTDLVIADEKGLAQVVKAPSTPEDPTVGVFDTLKLVAESRGVPLKELLSDCEVFVHGTTMATNAIIQRKAAKTGLICTRGFRDILYYRAGDKPDSFNFKMDAPEAYIPHYLTLPVAERINAQGEVVIPLNEDEVFQAIRQFREWNVKAIAVCLLWSPVNPVHEQRIGEMIAEEWPEVEWSISSACQPAVREWQRTSATALNASLKPMMRQYTQDLQRLLTDNGFRYNFFMVTCSGGIMEANVAAENPVYALLSGPVMGPVAGLYFAQQRGTNDIITIDMGGTSFDVSLVRQGRIATTRAAMMDELALGIASVEVNTIGAGGGSIAWVDSAGLLHVGPLSAGAVPGPACYMRGGEEPTVTDANVVLGYINPGYFLGGRMRIDPKLSAHAIQERVAKPLRIGLTEAASGIVKVVDQNMVGGISDISVRQGIDPREYVLVVGGGAGPVHVAMLARELGIKQILIPKLAAGLCAFGMLTADIKFDKMATYYVDSSAFDYEGINRVLSRLENEGKQPLERGGVSAKNIRFEYLVEARYPFQVYEIEIPLRSSRMTPETAAQLVEDFHATHEERYGFKEVGQKVECIHWRVVAIGVGPKPNRLEQAYRGEDASPALKGKRKAYFEDLGGFVETRVYDGNNLAHGNNVDGPAIIEEPATTVVVIPGSRVTVTDWGDYLMELL